MPHCIIEYSDNIESKVDPSTLVETVYEGAFSSGLFEGPDIKTRALPYKHFQTGAYKSGFIHVSIRILSGRTGVQKKHLSSSVIKELRSLSDYSQIKGEKGLL